MRTCSVHVVHFHVHVHVCITRHVYRRTCECYVCRMTVASSLTLGQLQSFLISKWQLVEEEGSEAGDDGSCHSQRLKLYHTHHDSIPTFRNEQPLHPTSLYTSKLDPATASSSTASACTMSTSARVQDRGAQTGLVRIAGNSGQQKSAVAVADSLHQCDSSSNTARCMCLRQEQSDKNSIPVSACSYTCGTTAGRTSQHHSECESHRESREGGGEEGGSEGEGSRDRLSVFVHSRHSAEGVAKNTDFHLDCPLGSYARKIDVKAQSTLSSIHLSVSASPGEHVHGCDKARQTSDTCTVQYINNYMHR